MNITSQQKASAFFVPPLKKKKKAIQVDGKNKDTYNLSY